MSEEMKTKMLQLLTQVDDVKAQEAALQTERKLHQEQIAKSETDLQRTDNDIEECRENALALRRQMEDLKNEIFARPDEEEVIEEDKALDHGQSALPSWWRARGLTGIGSCSMFVLMEVETLGVARSLGWKVHVRCANGYRQETRSMRRCVYRKQLDLETLVATRHTTVAILPQKLKLRPSHGRSS
jgi:hypothetical protein